jgi:hypothetical protein
MCVVVYQPLTDGVMITFYSLEKNLIDINNSWQLVFLNVLLHY